MVIRCVVRGCKTVGYSGFHGFPSNKDRCLQWIDLTKTERFDQQKLAKSFRKICKKHFRSTDYEDGTTRLKRSAVPSLYLPDQTSGFDVHTKIPDAHVNGNNYKGNCIVQTESIQSPSPEFSNEKTTIETFNVKRNLAGTRTMSMKDEKSEILRELKASQNKNKAYEKRIKDLKEKIKKRGKINDHKVLEYLGRKLTKGEMQFVQMLLRNSSRKPRVV